MSELSVKAIIDFSEKTMYQVQSVLKPGSGNFPHVVKAKRIPLSAFNVKECWAIVKYTSANFNEFGNNPSSYLGHEFEIMQALGLTECGHPLLLGKGSAALVTSKILQFFPEFFELPTEMQKRITQGNSVHYIAMECIPGYNLKTILEKCGRFPQDLARSFFRKILKSVQKLHGKKLVHSDIKPDNIVVSKYSEVYLIDFGLTQENCTYPLGGTWLYQPLEILKAEPAPNSYFCDYYALAVLLFKLLFNVLPFGAVSPIDKYYSCIFKYNYVRFWKRHSLALGKYVNFEVVENYECMDLLNHLFSPDPELRLSLSEIIAHPWLKAPLMDEHEFSERVYAMFLMSTNGKSCGIPTYQHYIDHKLTSKS